MGLAGDLVCYVAHLTNLSRRFTAAIWFGSALRGASETGSVRELGREHTRWSGRSIGRTETDGTEGLIDVRQKIVTKLIKLYFPGLWPIPNKSPFGWKFEFPRFPQHDPA